MLFKADISSIHIYILLQLLFLDEQSHLIEPLKILFSSQLFNGLMRARTDFRFDISVVELTK
jgi:hypothetical protein